MFRGKLVHSSFHALNSQWMTTCTCHEGYAKLSFGSPCDRLHMATSPSSETSSPRDHEPVMECQLVLHALSGTVVSLSMSVAKFDRFDDLEDHVVDYLASVTDLKVFGCTIDFLQVDTQVYLENPIWEKLQRSTEYTLVFRNCSEVLRRVPISRHPPRSPCPHEPRDNGT